MSPARLHPVFLLALVVAVAGLRPGWHLPHAHGDAATHVHGIELVAPQGYEHGHEHAHGGMTHHHVHRHHADVVHDDDAEHHHHGDVDPSEDMPKARWMAPRRIDVDAPPAQHSAAVASASHPTLGAHARRAKPPPFTERGTRHPAALRTVVLRL